MNFKNSQHTLNRIAMKPISRMVILALSLGASMTVSAQTASPAIAATADEEIVVTASRISRSGFTSPTPTNVVGSEEIERRGFTSVADALNEVPSFRATTTPTGGAQGTFNIAGGQNILDLRGMGAVRTLVLVNGRRHVPSNAVGTLDINLIPTVLIERTETVTGGASAAWGSDAVAGVVNLILKNNLNGVQGDVTLGRSQQGDAKEAKFALAGGTDYAGGLGHVLLGGEYVDNGKVDDYLSRAWGRQEYGVLANPNNAANGLPRNIIGPVMHYATQNAGGLITAGALKGITFDTSSNGSVSRAFQYGQVFGTSANMFGGEGYGITNNTFQNLKTPVKRYSVFGRSTYELSNSTSAWIELSTAKSDNNISNGSPRANYTIRNDNAFLPANIVAQMATAGVTSFTLGRYDADFGAAQLRAKNTTNRLAFGLKGDLSAGWTWDAYYQLGTHELSYRQANNLNLVNLNAALDAVRVNGAIVCRNPNLVTTTSLGIAATPAAGCVPINLFGNGAPSAAALSYLLGESWQLLKTKQQVAAANVRGEPFSTWAGAVAIAAGLEYRQERGDQDADALSQINAWNTLNPKPIHGKYSVKETYVETLIPLASKTAWAKSLDFNAAARRTDYSTSGVVTSWKAGLTYEPNSQFLLRGTKSRDIRAPNINELFSSSTFATSPLVNKNGVSSFVPTFTTGNPKLLAETADTNTVGIVFTPEWLPGFKASVDTYSIEMKGQITSLGSQQLYNRCIAGASELCANITFDAGGLAGGIATSIINPQINLLGFKASGTDIEASYRTKLSAFAKDMGGDISLRVLGTRVTHLKTIDTVGVVDRAGQTGVGSGVNAGAPNWMWNTALTYHQDRLSLTAQLRHIVKGIYDVTLVGPDNSSYSTALANSINDNTVPSRTYINLSGQYDLPVGKNSVQIYGVVNNLTDRDPPLTPTINVMTNGAFFDNIGRTYRVGARFTY